LNFDYLASDSQIILGLISDREFAEIKCNSESEMETQVLAEPKENSISLCGQNLKFYDRNGNTMGGVSAVTMCGILWREWWNYVFRENLSRILDFFCQYQPLIKRFECMRGFLGW